MSRVAPAPEQALHRLARDLHVTDPEVLRAAAEEATGALGPGGEVVLSPGRHLLGVVAPGQRRHLRQAYHRRDAPGRRRTHGAAVSDTRWVMAERERPVQELLARG